VFDSTEMEMEGGPADDSATGTRGETPSKCKTRALTQWMLTGCAGRPALVSAGTSA
jgi:hypothetical protein